AGVIDGLHGEMRVRGVMVRPRLAQRRVFARRRRVEGRPAVVTVDLPAGPRHDRLVLVLDAGSHRPVLLISRTNVSAAQPKLKMIAPTTRPRPIHSITAASAPSSAA